MKSGKPKVWKWQILSVLEDGEWKDAVRIKFELRKEFGKHFGKPTLNAVRKHMQRCSPQAQSLVSRQKIGPRYYYKINNKGRKRLRIIRAREHREFEKILREPAKRRKRNWVFYRAFEITTSLKLCDVVRQISRDKNTLSLAGAIKIYWQKEYAELIAYISEKQADMIVHLSDQMAKTVLKWLA